MKKDNDRLIVDGNAFYEIDPECLKNKKECERDTLKGTKEKKTRNGSII